ncbi:MAG: GntR family transcriptional regulator, partial [Pseudobdellovibrio sp.]|nr:GntR family transcriptional regulator [Pseudobdellovibrio sp.]
GGAIIHTSLMPTMSLQKSLIKVAKQNPHKVMVYEPIAGNAGLRKEIAKRTISGGFNTDAEGIVITNGCTEALALALRASTSPGDIVAVESPTYHGILRMLEDQGLKVLELASTSDLGVSLEDLEKKAQSYKIKAALLTPNFLNPVGSLMPDENKERLVQICYKNNITIIEDDIYSDLHFTTTRPLTLKSFDKKDKNFLCSSFSKTLSAGYRIGWIVPPESEREKILLFKSTSSLSTNTVLQMALADHLANHNYDRHLRRLRLALSQNIFRIAEAIEKYFPQGTKVTRPSGGCLLWVEFPAYVNTLQLYTKALKKNISVIPGCAFSSCDKYMNCLRINAGVPWNIEIEGALIEIGKMAAQMKN